MIEKSPFEVENQGETIDENFFVRLVRFENYYLSHSKEDESFLPNFNAMKEINQILQKEKLSMTEINEAIEVYNKTNMEKHHNGTGWFDLRLHLRHIAFIYGIEYRIDDNLNLIEKEACA